MPHKQGVQALDVFREPDRLIADGLRSAPLFADLPVEHRDCLALLREGAFFEVPPGIEIVSPGDLAALIVVTEGELCDQEQARAWPAGSFFGVSETLAGRPFVAAMQTVAPTRLYRLDAPLLKVLLTRCPVIAQRLLNNFNETCDVSKIAPCQRQVAS